MANALFFVLFGRFIFTRISMSFFFFSKILLHANATLQIDMQWLYVSLIFILSFGNRSTFVNQFKLHVLRFVVVVVPNSDKMICRLSSKITECSHINGFILGLMGIKMMNVSIWFKLMRHHWTTAKFLIGTMKYASQRWFRPQWIIR